MSESIRVLFFASLREDVGIAEISVQAHDTMALLKALAEQLPEPAMQALTQDNVRIAVNQQIIEGNTRLTAGDEVAFLPPVTGG